MASDESKINENEDSHLELFMITVRGLEKYAQVNN